MNKWLSSLLLIGLLLPGAASAGFLIDTVAGTGKAGYNGDDQSARAAQVAIPTAVAADTQGNLYIADRNNHRLRKVSAEGIISTLAGNGTPGFSGDNGLAAKASLNRPSGVAVDSEGNVYIADTENHVIRRIGTDGIIRTVAGTGQEGNGAENISATTSALKQPQAVLVGADASLYIADSGNHKVRRVSPEGIVTTLAGLGWPGFSGDDAAAAQAKLNKPQALALDEKGNLYIADTGNHRVRQIDNKGIIRTVAGSAAKGFAGDGGAAVRAQLENPQGVAVDGAGSLYIADGYNHRIRQVDSEGIIRTVAGSGFVGLGSGADGGDDGPATAARLFNPQQLTADGAGNIYIADSQNSRIRKLSPGGNSAYRIQTVAGAQTTGLTGGGYSGDDGPATHAHLKAPSSIVLDQAGNLYFTDSGNHRVRKVDTAGVISTVAGRGIQGYDGDGGPALEAMLKKPTGLAIDPEGSLYIADTDNQRVRQVTPDGMIRSIAGIGEAGFSGDGGLAERARLNTPRGVATDGRGNLYIADSLNHRVRKVDSTGVISTIAGNGEQGFSGDDGPAVKARLNEPDALALDREGNLYIADRRNYRIRKLTPEGMIYSVAGTGKPRYSQDGGPALTTALFNPTGLAVDEVGNLYVSEYRADRVRKISSEGVVSTLAGNGSKGYGGDGGDPLAALLDSPLGVAVSASGSQVFIADSLNHRIRKVAAASHILRVDREGNGHISAAPGLGKGIECGTQCSDDYLAGSAVVLQAKANEGYRFEAWDGDCSGSDDKIQLLMSADRSCRARFAAVDSANPAMLVTDAGCARVELPPAVDLSANYSGKTLLDGINAIPEMRNNGWRLRQDKRSGQAYLDLGPTRLTVRPVEADFQRHPPAIVIDEQQSIRLTTENGVILRLEPVAQGICQLHTLFARLGVGQLRMLPNGNLDLQITAERRLSLRPDWMTQLVDKDEPTGLFFSQAVLKGQITASLVFMEGEEETAPKRRQYLYPAPAQLDALFEFAEELSFEPLGVIRFKLDGESYHGLPDYVVKQDKAPAGAQLTVKAIEDMNNDGKADFLLHYPNGEQQILFSL